MYRKKGLVKMQGEKVTLQNIKGIGDKISEKILNSVGGEENLEQFDHRDNGKDAQDGVQFADTGKSSPSNPTCRPSTGKEHTC